MTLHFEGDALFRTGLPAAAKAMLEPAAAPATTAYCGHCGVLNGRHMSYCPIHPDNLTRPRLTASDFAHVRVADVPPVGIGDVTSDAKGSGARYNSGKPDMSLIPLTMVGEFYGEDVPLPLALRELGLYQQTQDTEHLFAVLSHLGGDGWLECARVFAYGKRKYAAWNWAKGMPWSVPLACAARHLFAMLDGEDTDPESGEPHRGHVFCNVVMLLQYAKTYTEGNDLPPKGLL